MFDRRTAAAWSPLTPGYQGQMSGAARPIGPTSSLVVAHWNLRMERHLLPGRPAGQPAHHHTFSDALLETSGYGGCAHLVGHEDGRDGT